MVAYTTTYNFKKPTVADDEDVWGGYLNDSMDLIDDVLDGTTPVTGIDINSGTVDNVVVGGTTAVAGTFTVLTANTSLGVTGNITVSGTVDGRDVAADGTKLDGVESGATADQTKADIDALGIAASTAATLATARNIALSGDVSGNVNFDGSGNVTITTTVADDSHNHVISNVDGLQTALDGKLDERTSSNWNTATSVVGNVVGQLGWKNYGNNHTIFDASNSTSPSGTSVNNTNASVPWSGTYPTLMGWNGASTYGVRVDSARIADNISSYTVNQSVGSGNSPSFAGLNINGNLNAVDNIYLAATVYHEGDTNTYLSFSTDTVYLASGGTDRVIVDNSGVRLGDTGNGYFQPVSGNYGSIQIDGGAHGGWEGYSIGGRAVFMHDNSNSMGLFDDVNNKWALTHAFNGAVDLYHNGASKLDTLSNGVSINGNLYTDGSNAEDYDALSGTSPTCNVDNAGAFSLTMSGNTTFTFSGADNGWSMGFILQLTGNGSTVTWPSSVDWAGGTAPDAPASGETDIYVFWTRNGGTTWYGVQSIDAAA